MRVFVGVLYRCEKKREKKFEKEKKEKKKHVANGDGIAE